MAPSSSRSAWRLLGSVAIAAGCAPPSEGEDPPLVPSEHRYDAPDRAPALDAADVQAALDESWPRLVGANPVAVYDAYSLAMAQDSNGCPGVREAFGLEVWDNGCTTSSGWAFEGRSGARHTSNWEIDGQVYEEYGAFLQSDCRMRSPQGEEMSFAGYGELMDWTDADRTRWFSSWLMGEYAWESATGDGTWLTEAWSLSVIVETGSEVDGVRWMRIDGGASGVDAPLGTITAQALELRSDAACTREPTGALSVRTDEGDVYVATFGADEACDACGEVRFGDVPLGDVCLDFSAMIDWDGRPW